MDSFRAHHIPAGVLKLKEREFVDTRISQVWPGRSDRPKPDLTALIKFLKRQFGHHDWIVLVD
jgi:hypothetical protein